MDNNVLSWRQKGHVYFWLEDDRKQGKGWHLAADKAGCDDLSLALGLAKEAIYPSRFAFKISSNGPCKVKTLVLSHNAGWADLHWALNIRGDFVVLEIGPKRFTELSQAVVDIQNGIGDYTIGGEDENQRIWVWWTPEQK